MGYPEPMHILLTNDDGHEAPGILALQRALKASGHRVSMVAPSEEQSSTSMSTTPHRSIALQQLNEQSWHLDARPADAVLVALRHLLRDDPPDLVLAGVNFGPNLGTGLHRSGTIGAAVMALINGFPAIAVSAGMCFKNAKIHPAAFPAPMKYLIQPLNLPAPSLNRCNHQQYKGKDCFRRGFCSTSTTRHCPKAISRACSS